jgi:LacI family transcriptional regulator
MANIYDVAKQAGVSIASVSLVMNDPDTPRVGVEKRSLILKTATRMGYVPNGLAKALSCGSTKIVGLVVPLRDPIFFNMFIAQVLAGVQSALVKHGYHLMIYSHDAANGRITKAELFQSRYVDGIIVLNTRLCSDQDIRATIQDLEKANIPFVMSNCYSESQGINYIGVDDEAIGKAAGQYLLGKGHTRLGMISGASQSPMSRHLLRGFAHALDLANQPLNDDFHVFSEYDDAVVQSSLKRWFAQPNPPTAIFCADDQLVSQVYRTLAQLKKKVPRDVAVLGRGNLGVASAVHPALSTISVPAYDMGSLSAEMLIKAIENPAAQPTKHILPSPMVERASA